MKKKMVFVIAILSIGFSRLSLGKELITESQLK